MKKLPTILYTAGIFCYDFFAFRGSSAVEQVPVKHLVVGSSHTPGDTLSVALRPLSGRATSPKYKICSMFMSYIARRTASFTRVTVLT